MNPARAQSASLLELAGAPGLSRRSALVVLAFGVVSLGAGLGAGWALTRHEVLAAQPAREMLAEGRWIVPHFAGEPRVLKPPTMGWAIAAFMAVGGEAEWVVRLPSALAGLITGLMVAWAGGRWLGDRAGLVAGLVQLSSVHLLMQARLAEADMPLAACVVGSLLCFLSARAPSRMGVAEGRWWAWAFWVLAGVAFLFKGPVGPLFVAVGVACWMALKRDLGAWRFLASPVGLAAFIVLVGAWPLAAWRAYPPIAEAWWQETLGRAAGELREPHPWWLYLVNTPLMLLPWLPACVVAVLAVRRDGSIPSTVLKWAGLFVGVSMLLLSLMAFKAKHYMLPALPPMSLVAAVGLLAVVKRSARATTAVFGVVLACIVGVMLWVMPKFDDYRPSADLGRAASRLVPPGRTVYLVGLREAHVAFYVRLPVKRIDDVDRATLDLTAAESYAIAPLSAAAALEREGFVEELARMERPASRRDREPLVLLRIRPRTMYARGRGPSGYGRGASGYGLIFSITPLSLARYASATVDSMSASGLTGIRSFTCSGRRPDFMIVSIAPLSIRAAAVCASAGDSPNDSARASSS